MVYTHIQKNRSYLRKNIFQKGETPGYQPASRHSKLVLRHCDSIVYQFETLTEKFALTYISICYRVYCSKKKSLQNRKTTFTCSLDYFKLYLESKSRLPIPHLFGSQCRTIRLSNNCLCIVYRDESFSLFEKLSFCFKNDKERTKSKTVVFKNYCF